MGRKKWLEVDYDKARAVELAGECDADVFSVLLMMSRGLDTPEKINAFLDAESQTLSSPFLMLDMDLAVARITAAIENGERILIYGDYDADGVTATAVLYSYLQSAGAEVSYYIPDRIDDGYGLSMKTAAEIVSRGVELVVTVDNGISSVEEAAFLRENGVDLIVTDHHTVGEEIPDCVAVVNPHRSDDTSPEKNLAGCGVAFKLACALEGGDWEALCDELLDLVAIGTVADIVPLTGENRTIVSKGLRLLSDTSRPGLRKLMEAVGIAGRPVRSSDVAFSLAPKINAAGRIYNANLAIDLLLSEDETGAAVLSDRLMEANARRQELENEIIDRIEADFDADPDRRSDKIIVAAGRDFHPGVIGIVASRLLEKYGRPAFVITTDGSGIAKGSARSVEGFPLYDALSAVSDVLVRFGGHRQAAGFALRDEDVGRFRKMINDYSADFDDVFTTLRIDCRINADKMTPAMADSLDLLQPFGAENPEPTFAVYNMRLSGIRPVKDNRHLKLTLSNSQATVSAIYFNMSQEEFPFRAGDLVDLAFRVSRSEYLGKPQLSVMVRSIRGAGTDEDGLFASLSAYYDFRLGKINDSLRAALCPNRVFVISVYKYIRENGGCVLTPEILCARLGESADNAGRAQVCLDALTELGLVVRSGDSYSVNARSGKTDLTDSVFLQTLGYKDA